MASSLPARGGSRTGALLWASSTCPFRPSGLSHLSPTHQSSTPLTSSPFMPTSTSLETPLLASANGGAASCQDALCQSLLLLLSVCGDSSCHGLQMGAVGASGVSCVCSPWRWAPGSHVCVTSISSSRSPGRDGLWPASQSEDPGPHLSPAHTEISDSELCQLGRNLISESWLLNL